MAEVQHNWAEFRGVGASGEEAVRILRNGAKHDAELIMRTDTIGQVVRREISTEHRQPRQYPQFQRGF